MAHRPKAKRGQVHLCPTKTIQEAVAALFPDRVIIRRIKPGSKHRCEGVCV